MKAEETNIRIAELSGLFLRPAFEGFLWCDSKDKFVGSWLTHKGTWHGKLPDYLSDLNACADFEMTLTKPGYENFITELSEICERDYSAKLHIYNQRDRVSATATQRCAAFLRIKNKS